MIQNADFISVSRAFAHFKKGRPNCIKSEKLLLKMAKNKEFVIPIFSAKSVLKPLRSNHRN